MLSEARDMTVRRKGMAEVRERLAHSARLSQLDCEQGAFSKESG